MEEDPTGKPIKRSTGQPHVCFPNKIEWFEFFCSRHHWIIVAVTAHDPTSLNNLLLWTLLFLPSPLSITLSSSFQTIFPISLLSSKTLLTHLIYIYIIIFLKFLFSYRLLEKSVPQWATLMICKNSLVCFYLFIYF